MVNGLILGVMLYSLIMITPYLAIHNKTLTIGFINVNNGFRFNIGLITIHVITINNLFWFIYK